MKPVNSKSLFAHLCNMMEKLDKGEIDNETANTQANLVNKANNLLNLEINRAKLTGRPIREIESKGFDDTTNIKQEPID